MLHLLLLDELDVAFQDGERSQVGCDVEGHHAEDGDDVATVLFGEIAEARVDGCGFPAASRAGEQQQACGLAEKSGDLNAGGFGESEFAERFDGGRIEQAKDNFFASHRRDRKSVV